MKVLAEWWAGATQPKAPRKCCILYAKGNGTSQKVVNSERGMVTLVLLKDFCLQSG